MAAVWVVGAAVAVGMGAVTVESTVTAVSVGVGGGQGWNRKAFEGPRNKSCNHSYVQLLAVRRVGKETYVCSACLFRIQLVNKPDAVLVIFTSF